MGKVDSQGPPGEVFRDGTQGAEARRQELLRERRLQLSVQPLEVRALYVRRAARAITGLGLFGATMLLLLAGSERSFYLWLAQVLPGNAPAPLATLFTGILVGSVTLYFVARSWAERRYTLAMRRAISESHDVYGDVNRLATEHPDQLGERMAARLSTWSFEGPILATIALGPLLWAFTTEALLTGWPTANWIDATFSSAAGGLRWLMVIFAGLTLWFCHGFRPGHAPSRFWKPSVISAAILVPVLSTTLCACVEASRAVGLAGVTVFFALGVLWALHQRQRES